MTIYVSVVELGSFVATAQQFRISAAMVGLHVRQLEKTLGARLINRTTRRHSLTEIGRIYYESCKRILSDIVDAEIRAAQYVARPHGRIRVVSPVSFGVHGLAPICSDYLTQNSDVAIDLVLDDRPIDIFDQAADVVVRIGDLEDCSMIAIPLAPYRSVVCASRGYLEQHGIPSDPSELSSHQCLGFAHPTASQVWSLRGDNGPMVIPIKIALSANNGEALRNAALSGLGVVMQPEILLQSDIAAGRLVPVLTEFSPPEKPMHILIFPDQYRTPKVRSFVDFLSLHFGRGKRKQN